MIRLEDDRSTVASIATVRSTFRDKLLPTKGNTTVTTFPSFYIDGNSINKFRHGLSQPTSISGLVFASRKNDAFTGGLNNKPLHPAVRGSGASVLRLRRRSACGGLHLYITPFSSSFFYKRDNAVSFCKKRVVVTHTDVIARKKPGASLPNKNISCANNFAAKFFHTKSPASRVATV